MCNQQTQFGCEVEGGQSDCIWKLLLLKKSINMLELLLPIDLKQ